MATGARQPARAASRGRLANWPSLPFWLLIAAIGAVTFAAQILLHARRDPAFALLDAQVALRHLALPGLTVYMLLMFRALKRKSGHSLKDLRAAVDVSDQDYDRVVTRVTSISRRMEAAMLGLAGVIVVAIFVILRSDLPFNALPQLGKAHVPDDPLAGGFVVASYALFGWAGLSLVYASVEFGRGLQELADRPLRVNVYDPSNLLPFGTLSLLHSLAVAGVVLGLLLVLGQPETWVDFAVVIVASIASALSLALPLAGVRRQMLQAKYAAVAVIHARLSDCQDSLMALADHNPDTLKALSTATDTLLNMRRTILAQPSWPFRSALASTQVIVAAMAPLIYFTLNELMRTYILPFLVRIR